MKVVNLGQQNTILNTYVAEIRDARIQKDSMRTWNGLAVYSAMKFPKRWITR